MRTTEAITKLRAAGYRQLADELDDGEASMAEVAAALRASSEPDAGELADAIAPSGKATLSAKAKAEAEDATKGKLSTKGDDDPGDDDDDDDDDAGAGDDDDPPAGDPPTPKGAAPQEDHWALRPVLRRNRARAKDGES